MPSMPKPLAKLARRILPPTSGAVRPRLACEILPEGVVAARLEQGRAGYVSAFAPLPPGSLVPDIKAPNLADRPAVIAALRQALDEVRLRDNRIALVIPDAAVRVMMLDFDALPERAAEALPILRFRLRKLVPFDTDNAAVGFQLLPAGTGAAGLVRAVVSASPAEAIAEYESAVREAGYEPGAVLPSTMACLAAIAGDEPALLINRNANCVTTAIARREELLLHRTVETTAKDGSPEPNAQRLAREFRQSVSVAIAYFEDTLGTPPRQLFCCGPGGAGEMASLLENSEIPARDLEPLSRAGAPRGIFAGVAGALAS